MIGENARRLALSAFIAGLCLGVHANANEAISIKATWSGSAKGTSLQAELFRPKGDGPFPAVILLHGCGGWQPSVLDGLHAHAMRFLDRGYVVLNLDSFGPRGTSGGTVCKSNARLMRALEYRTQDAFDALRYMRALPYVEPDNIFLMGQSNGGSVAINAAKMTGRRGFRAVAAYYPWCGSLGGTTVKLVAPLMIFSGGRDDWAPASECRHKRAVGASLKVIEYAKAAHSFDLQIPPQHYLGRLIGYDKSATEDSRARILAFFDITRAPPKQQPPAKAQASLHGADLAALTASWLRDIDLKWSE